MANLDTKFVTSFSELYFRPTGLAAGEITDPKSWFTAAGTLKIPNVAEIGSLSNEASVIETPTFGDSFKGKLRGQLDAGQLDTQLYWAPRNTTHLAMRNAATVGTPCSFGIKWKSDSTGTNAEHVVFDGFLSSFGIDTAFDDVAKASSTIVVNGALTFDDDAA